MKLWKKGVRIFKGINSCKVYHFGSIVLRKKINTLNKNNKFGSRGGKIFLLKWGLSIKFFKKFYLRSNQVYNGPLIKPKINLVFIFRLILCKLNYIYLKIFYKKKNLNLK